MENIQYAQKEGSGILVYIYNGRTIDQMPKLIGQENTPMSVADLIDLRNRAFKSGNDDWIKQVCYNYFDSGDGIVYHPNGNIKIDLDSANLRGLTSNSEKNLSWNGALNLEKEIGAKRFADLPNEIDGVQLLFTPEEIKEYTGNYLTESQVPKNKFWLAFARGDEERLGTYAREVYSRNNDSELMKVWISPKSPDFEAERLWCLDGFDFNSSVDGDYDGQLDDSDGRLAGVAPEAQTCDEVGQNQRINLEGLVSDFKILREAGDLSPKIEEILKTYNI